MASRYWANDNGEITCEKHAGAYLTASIFGHPRRHSHRTPLGTWQLIKPVEVTELEEILGKPIAQLCSTPHPTKET